MADRCPSTRLSGAHCTLEVGHTGSHMEVEWTAKPKPSDSSSTGGKQ